MYDESSFREIEEIGTAGEFSLVARLDLTAKLIYKVTRSVIPECLRSCNDVIYIPGISVMISRGYLEAKAGGSEELRLKDLLVEKMGKIAMVNPARICRLS